MVTEGGPVKVLKTGTVVLWRGWLCRVLNASIEHEGKPMALIERRDGWKDLVSADDLRQVRIC